MNYGQQRFECWSESILRNRLILVLAGDKTDQGVNAESWAKYEDERQGKRYELLE